MVQKPLVLNLLNNMNHIIDAQGQKLGRIATQVAHILQGKHSTTYDPRLEGEDSILVKNIEKLVVTGNKEEGKIYYRHTGFIGHLKKRTFKEAFERSPEKVLRKAVYNMLPKNRLRNPRLNRLVIEK